MAPYYDNAAAFGSNLDPAKARKIMAGGWERFDRGFRYEIVIKGSDRPYIDQLLSVYEELGTCPG